MGQSWTARVRQQDRAAKDRERRARHARTANRIHMIRHPVRHAINHILGK